MSRFNAVEDSTRQAISRSLACLFSSTFPEEKERLLVVYCIEKENKNRKKKKKEKAIIYLPSRDTDI